MAANRGEDGSGWRNSAHRVPEGFLPAQEGQKGARTVCGRKRARAITAGRSMASSVIQGGTETEPKQPQEAAPVRAL